VRADKKTNKTQKCPPPTPKKKQNKTQKQTSTHKKQLKYVNKWRSYRFKQLSGKRKQPYKSIPFFLVAKLAQSRRELIKKQQKMTSP